MWIQVRSMDGKKSARIDGLSKLTKIEDLREKLVEPFEAATECQRLFYRGKQMIDGYTLFDYNVGLNEIIQILIKAPVAPGDGAEKDSTESEADSGLNDPAEGTSSMEVDEDCENLNSTYKIGDVIDVRDEIMGAWFEASIIKLSRKRNSEASSSSSKESVQSDEAKDSDGSTTEKTLDDGVSYLVKYDDNKDDDSEPVSVTSSYIRPRSRRKISFASVKIGDRVMLNFNYDEPETRGYWYDAVITGKQSKRTVKELYTTVYIGKDLVAFENCKIAFIDELYAIEKPGDQINALENTDKNAVPEKRENKPECSYCGDNPRRKCKECGCSVCGDRKEPDRQIMCDECDHAFHIYCLNPPLDAIPDVDEWYCPDCKNDTSEVVHAGEKLKESKKKSKMASANSSSTRDWGKGMACVGRTKVCTIVPPNHFGLIPGIEVGMCWKFRVQVSEAGVHRPHVAGIHGREDDGAYSIVLAGGYEDDQDDGEEFTYTGSGGRDLSGNKRTAEQSCDQTLTRMNRALAKNVCASINDKKGADAGEKWKEGKPVRVLRSFKGKKHSKYSPEDGIRYDGIYKIVKYWPEKGKSGFIVWRYLLRRDDANAAPWTKAGKKKIEELGLTIQYPEGYLESKQQKQTDNETDDGESAGKGKKKSKRKRIESDDENEEQEPEEEEESQKSKKQRRSIYSVDSSVKNLIKSDSQNEKLWNEALDCVNDGAQAFLNKVEELFLCICCQEIVYNPVTTDCLHNMCKSCLERSFKADVYSCPACRSELGKTYKISINTSLSEALLKLFPGYENGR